MNIRYSLFLQIICIMVVLIFNTGNVAQSEKKSDAKVIWQTKTNVGIPSNIKLRTYSGKNETITNGQIFDGLEFSKRIYIKHTNVIFRNCKLNAPAGDPYVIYCTKPKSGGDSNLTIENCEITGGLNINDGFIARKNHIHAPKGGYRDDGIIFAASNVLIEFNLIDGLVGAPGSHVDGIQVEGGSNITIRNNWIEAVSPPIKNGGITAAIAIMTGKGAVNNIIIENNMLIQSSGYYPLRIYSATGKIIVKNNQWRPGTYGNPVHVKNTAISVWENNHYENGDTIPRP